MNQTVLAILICSIVGTLGLFGLAYVYATHSGVSLTVHSWIAIGLGTVVSLGLSAVLFGLTFHSSRSGHDDDVGID